MATIDYGPNWTALTSAMTAMKSQAATMTQNAIGLGLALLGALVVWAGFWALVDLAGERHASRAFAGLIRTVLHISILAAFMFGYATAEGPKGLLVDGVDDIATRLTGTDSSTAVGSAISVLVNGLQGFDSVTEVVTTPDPQSSGGVLSQVTSAASAMLSQSWNVIKVLVRYTILIVINALLIAAIAVYFIVYLLAEINIALALIFGPLLLPWRLTETFRFLSDGWIKFAVGAGLFKIVAVVLVQLAGGVAGQARDLSRTLAKQVTDAAGNSGATPWIDFLSAAPLILLLLALIVSIWKSYQYAQSLLSGSGASLAPSNLKSF